MSDPITRLNAALEGRYRIERELGAGGMANVYLAEDLKHERRVALKVLKPELAAVMGPERFLAEIRTTANLTHPHILPLHDSGEADGFLFYVMPFVKGESLRQRLDREGQLPVEEAVRIAGHMADALDHAHRQGVIHRDVKPSNILFEDDQPVVTDFGIALAVSAAGGGRLTETGLSLGTPYYMSPEQAAGDQTATAASDVYSLGCVLYEMLTGEPPHTGASAQAILGKILLAEVTRPTTLRRTIPAHVEGVVLKSLERLPADRFESAAHMGAALKDKAFRYGAVAGAGTAGGLWNWLTVTFGIVAVLASAFALTRIFAPPAPLPAMIQQEIAPFGVGVWDGWEDYTALAPDGSSMIYVDTLGLGFNIQLWLKERASVDGRPLSGTTGVGGRVTYSPDGAWIAYRMEGDLVKRPLQGAGTVTLLEGVGAGPVHWGTDGTLLVGQAGGVLVRVPEEGGAPPDTVFVFPEHSMGQIQGLPGGEAALVIRCLGQFCAGGSDLSVVDLSADTAWVLLDDVVRAWYAPTGHLVWVSSDGAVFATPFDPSRLETEGMHEPLFEGVTVSGANRVHMVLAQDGTAIFVERSLSDNRVMWVDRAGRSEAVDPGGEPGPFFGPALSPDGRYLAGSVTNRGSDGSQIWVKDLSAGPWMQLTTGDGWRAAPAWSPDGATIAYLTSEAGPYRVCALPSSGRSSADCEVLLDLDRGVVGAVFTRDGQGVVFQSGGRIAFLDLTTGTVAEDLRPGEPVGRDMALSPDGRWIAYTLNVTGRREVYVSPFPDVASRTWRVSTDGGLYPLWAPNGRELFYRGGDRWVTVATYTADSVFTVEGRERLFDPGFSEAVVWRSWDITPAGDRFVMVFPPPTGSTRWIQIRNLWTELEERAAR